MKKNDVFAKFHSLFITFLLFTLSATAQVGIGTTTPASGALLDLTSTDRGLLVPRVSINNLGTAAPVTAPTTGLLVWNTFTGAGIGVGYHYWNGTRWIPLGNGGVDWALTGNANATVANFLGTTNNIPLNIRTNNVERIRILSNGRIGINTTAPGSQFHFIAMNATGWITQWDNTTNDGGLARFQHSSATNGSRVVMGTTNYSGSVYQAAGVMGLSLNNTDTGTNGIKVIGAANNESSNAVEGLLAFTGTYAGYAGYFNADVYSAGNYYTGSDKRLKRDIEPLNNVLGLISQITPVSYYYDTEKYPEIGFDENRLSYGFIAQDLEQVIPEMVKDKSMVLNANTQKKPDFIKERKTEEFKVVNYTLMVPILTQAIKEQQVIIEAQNDRISYLEEKMALLENKINVLMENGN